MSSSGELSPSDAAVDDPTVDPKEEWVLLVPPKLAKSSYATLVASQCVFRPFHLQGRFGSRTHKHAIDDGSNAYKIGIPVLSRDHVLQQAMHKSYSELNKLLQEEGAEFVWKPFTPSNRAVRDPPYFDARIHPDRQLDITRNKIKKPSKASFAYVDLFAGMGGFAVALDALEGTCLVASEIDTACQRLYKHNFPRAPLLGDIYNIQNHQLPTTTLVDLLVGGFPCQPFSALGDQPGIDCPKAGGLFLEIVRLLKVIQPKAFLLENVPGLLAMKGTFEAIKQALEGAGYNVTYEVCNARCLTATSRKRLFLVGFLKQERQQGISANSKTTFEPSSEQRTFRFPYVPDLQLKAYDVIDYTNQELSTMERDLLPISDDQLDQLNKGRQWRPAHMAWPNTVCDTLVSHYGNSIARGHSQLVPVSASSAATTNTSNTNPRRFSPRECLRLMGFPNSYQLLPKSSDIQGDRAFLKEQYRMAGNAVCPPLIAALAGAVLGYALDDHRWVTYGRQVAVDLAYQATRKGRPDDQKSTKRPFDAIELS
jgi:DNA (cytosine-5)-methyltransferase 1